ncbi:MAG: hypothetical protein K2L73_04855, partial [Muribaculaceae bacterium]|nr:hypothetical protein [Muribaculaceae bacterium]
MKKLLLFAVFALVFGAFGAKAVVSFQESYLEDFNKDAMPEEWVVKDNNHDGYTWRLWFNSLQISEFFQTIDLNDDLTSPAFMLDRLHRYVVRYKASRVVGQNDQAPKLEVRMGLSPNFDEMQQVIAPEAYVTDYLSDGVYYVITTMAKAPLYFWFRA